MTRNRTPLPAIRRFFDVVLVISCLYIAGYGVTGLVSGDLTFGIGATSVGALGVAIVLIERLPRRAPAQPDRKSRADSDVAQVTGLSPQASELINFLQANSRKQHSVPPAPIDTTSAAVQELIDLGYLSVRPGGPSTPRRAAVTLDLPLRHLVLEMDYSGGQPGIAMLACSTDPESFDRSRHTLVAWLATCPDCKAVQAARVAVIDAGGPDRV